MKCYTIGISHDGSFEINPGIQFEKTENPLIGSLVFDEYDIPIDLYEGFEGTTIHNVMTFTEGKIPILVAGLLVNDDFGYFDDEVDEEEIISDVVLKAIREDINSSRIVLLINIVGDLKNEPLDEMYDWDSVRKNKKNKDTYGSISFNDDSYLLSVHKKNFDENFELAEFNFNIKFDEDGNPQIQVTEINDSTEEED